MELEQMNREFEAITGRPALVHVDHSGPTAWMFLDRTARSYPDALAHMARLLNEARLGERSW